MRAVWVLIVVSLLFFVGCGKEESKGSAEKTLLFWHAMSDQKATALREIVEEYNRSNPKMKVKAEFIGDYDVIYRKTMTALSAKRPPDLAMAYENMVAEYMKYDAVADLTKYFKAEGENDIYPTFMMSNRYPAFGDKLLSMPMTKSVLVLYYNADMLKEIGKDKPPVTWEEFIADCRAIKTKKNISPLALSRDASTFDGLVFSLGGEVYDSKTRKALFDQSPTIQSLKLLGDLFREGLAHEIAYRTYDDRNDFASGRAAFFIRSSTSRPYVMEFVKNKFKWGMVVIPHGKDNSPRTILFGANVCVFKSTPEREKAAGDFMWFFGSKDITAKWATRTGYLPVRKSSLEVPELKTFLQQHPANRQTVDVIEYAYPEPSVRGWQEVRTVIERTMSDVIAKRKTPEQAAKDLQKESQAIIDQ